MRKMTFASVTAASLVLAFACQTSPPEQTEHSATKPESLAPKVAAPLRPRFIAAPRELAAVEPFIQEQIEIGLSTQERTLVYVGAPWCEPCQRLHAAVESGELDNLLGGTRLLEFDADRHGALLNRAGYSYQLIPVVALPAPDGRSTGRMLSGSIKGPTAVSGNLVPRLHALLEGREVD
jgi:hypothetical protein